MEKNKKRHAYFKSGLQTRAEGEQGQEKYIEGYFIVFNEQTELWTGTFEKIAPSALDETIKGNDIRCLFNHNTDLVLARQSAGTLELKINEKGLWAKVKINENDQTAMDVYARVQRGDITGCSFGFYADAESYEEKGGNIIWTIERATVFEISVCTFPAYQQTEIEAREKDYESQRSNRISQRKADLKNKLEGIKC